MLRNLIVLPDGTELYSGSGVTNYLRSVTVSECVNSGTELKIGSVCTNMLEATIISADGSLNIEAGMEVTLYRVDDSGARTKVGLFMAEKPTRSSAKGWKLTAYDRVSRLDKDLTGWLASLDDWPYSLIDFSRMVCTQCGLTLANESLPSSDFLIWKFAASGITGRKLLSWVGEICAQFCRATPDGAIEFSWYKAASCSIGPSAADGVKYYFSGGLSYEDYQVAPIEKVQIQFSDNDVGVIWPNSTETGNTYRITGNYLLLTDTTDRLMPVAQSVYNALKDTTYTPGKVSLPSTQDIHAGDIVSVTDSNGKQVQMYIMTRKQSGLRDTLECTGNRRRDSVTTVNNQTFAALNGKMLNLQTSVEGLKAEAKELRSDADGNTERIAALEVISNGISSEVSSQSKTLEQMDQEMTSIRQTASEVSIQVQDIRENGVDKVTTGMGYTFGDDGLRIQKIGGEMANLLDDTGMYVKRGDEVILQANNKGVVATDVTVRNYLIVGSHARFEDYSDGTDDKRTACFWI